MLGCQKAGTDGRRVPLRSGRSSSNRVPTLPCPIPQLLHYKAVKSSPQRRKLLNAAFELHQRGAGRLQGGQLVGPVRLADQVVRRRHVLQRQVRQLLHQRVCGKASCGFCASCRPGQSRAIARARATARAPAPAATGTSLGPAACSGAATSTASEGLVLAARPARPADQSLHQPIARQAQVQQACAALGVGSSSGCCRISTLTSCATGGEPLADAGALRAQASGASRASGRKGRRHGGM